MNDKQFRHLQGIVLKSPLLSALLHDWDKIALPDAWLVAGAIAQTLWNQTFGFPPAHGINDIDIVYFDANDLSEDAEVEHSARVRRAFSDLPVWIDVKNEARVHLWYEGKFGYPIKPYTSTTDAIATFPTTATAVGVRPGSGSLENCALPLAFPISLAALCVQTSARSGGRFTSRRSVDGSKSGQALV